MTYAVEIFIQESSQHVEDPVLVDISTKHSVRLHASPDVGGHATTLMHTCCVCARVMLKAPHHNCAVLTMTKPIGDRGTDVDPMISMPNLLSIST